MPEATAECITEDGYLRTGDRGEIDEEGRLRITGRIKELFKTSKGKYVAPVPIENLLNADRHVEQSCVLGSGFPQPVAVVMLAEELRGQVPDDPGAAGLIRVDERGFQPNRQEPVARDGHGHAGGPQGG